MNVLARARFAPAQLALGLLCAACVLAALFPDWGLRPIESLVTQMRAPQYAVPVARAFFIVAAIASAAVAVWWDAVARTCENALDVVASWPAYKFALIAALAAILPRLVVAIALPYEPTSDALWYHDVAGSIARGEGVSMVGEPTAFRSPGYAFLLSVLYWVAGDHVELAWVWGAISTVVLLFAVHDIAKRLYDEAIARVATLLVALYPALILMTGQTMSDLPFLAGMYALMAFALRTDGERVGDAIIIGLAAGLLSLVRSVGAGLVVLLPAIWWLRTRDTSRFLRATVIAALACAACLAPWMARNAVALDRFTIGTNGGSNLLVGSRPDASGWRDRFELPDSVLAAPDEVSQDDAMRNEALSFIRDHPADALAILPHKLVAMYLLETQAVTSQFQGKQRAGDAVRHFLFGASQLAWISIALLVLARVVSWRRKADRPRGARWSGWLLVAYFTAICLVFHGEDRYRLPIMPWFIIEAAAFAVAAAQRRSLSMMPLSSSSEPN